MRAGSPPFPTHPIGIGSQNPGTAHFVDWFQNRREPPRLKSKSSQVGELKLVPEPLWNRTRESLGNGSPTVRWEPYPDLLGTPGIRPEIVTHPRHDARPDAPSTLGGQLSTHVMAHSLAIIDGGIYTTSYPLRRWGALVMMSAPTPGAWPPPSRCTWLASGVRMIRPIPGVTTQGEIVGAADHG